MSHSPSSFAAMVGQKIIHPKELHEIVQEIRLQGKSIATLNGSFDLMHAGHLEMIYQASLQADVLIVALNTDRSIQEYKSPKRPFIPLQERMEMMGALSMVDYVTYFDEVDPCALLRVIIPDVHVNGAEYGENCIEAPVLKELGAKLHIVQLVPGFSTSNLIKKIASTC